LIGNDAARANRLYLTDMIYKEANISVCRTMSPNTSIISRTCWNHTSM